MFEDKNKLYEFSKEISAREKENKITELIFWVKENLTQDNVRDFTYNRFDDAGVFLSRLFEVYQMLGVRGSKGEYCKFLLFIAGDDRNKIYVSHLVAAEAEHKNIFIEKLGMNLEKIRPNLSKLNWRQNVSI